MGKRLIIGGALGLWLLDQIVGRVRFARDLRTREAELWHMLLARPVGNLNPHA